MTLTWSWAIAILVVVLVLVLPIPWEKLSIYPTPPEGNISTYVTRVIDGDTVLTDAGRVRLIGIDSPERGQPGYYEAKQNLHYELPRGTRVFLVSVNTKPNTDHYGRLLRYVYVGDRDIGLQQLRLGHARARYDSRDGYGAHPRESVYIATQRRSPFV